MRCSKMAKLSARTRTPSFSISSPSFQMTEKNGAGRDPN